MAIQVMGLFATVLANVECPTCGRSPKHGWQFYFGAVDTLPVYNIGDDINHSGCHVLGCAEPHVQAIAYCDGETFCDPCGHADALANVAIVPAFPGCYSQGETVEQALANAREAISLTIEDMQANGELIPDPSRELIGKVAVGA